MPGPRFRQNDTENRWPNGVLSGGMIIDLLECLSSAARTLDYALVLWLKAGYVEPFGRIERLDGLVVAETKDLKFIHHAHERFVEVLGERSRLQNLWVSGLEPVNSIKNEGVFPTLPPNTEYKVWRASDMYFKNGIEVPRKGKCEGMVIDALRWERTVWSMPDADEEIKKEDFEDVNVNLKEPDQMPLEELPSQPRSAPVSPRSSSPVKALSSVASMETWYMSSPDHTKSA